MSGIPNYDAEAGIHYGFIYQNDVSGESTSDIYDKGTDLGWEAAKSEAQKVVKGAADALVEEQWSEHASDGESGPYRYEQDGYIIDTTSDNGLFIIKSPYFTYCRECSPCAPNAGYLKSQPGSMKTYCLGPDWFDEYAPLPYTVYSVATGEVVKEGPKEEEE